MERCREEDAMKTAARTICGKLGAILVGLGCLGGTGIASTAPFCPGTRFVVQDANLIGADNAILIGEPSSISFVRACGPVFANFRTTKKGIRVRATLPSCGEAGGKLLLRAQIDRACAMTGALVNKKSRTRRPFLAAHSAC